PPGQAHRQLKHTDSSSTQTALPPLRKYERLGLADRLQQGQKGQRESEREREREREKEREQAQEVDKAKAGAMSCALPYDSLPARHSPRRSTEWEREHQAARRLSSPRGPSL